MKITLEERNLMTLINIAKIVGDSLKYVGNPSSPNYSEDERKRFKQTLENLISEGSPFELNCKNNGDFGNELYQDVQYFISDVFDKEGRIVSSDLNDLVHVEESLENELFSTICKIRIRLEALIDKGIELLKENKHLDLEVEQLFNLDKLFYHSYAGKVGSELLFKTFIELNNASRVHQETYSRTHNNIDPRKDPNFDQNDDASVRMLANEFGVLNRSLIEMLDSINTNNKDYLYAVKEFKSDLDVFAGKKTPANFQSFGNLFISHFDKLIPPTLNELNKVYNFVADELSVFDKKMIEEIKNKKGD